MNARRSLKGVAQAGLVLLIVAALVAALVIVFRGISRGAAAAPTSTVGPATGYPAPAPTQSGYPAPGATSVGSPDPAPSQMPTLALPPLHDSPDQFDPKTYGLPDTIAGYTILGVITAENNACLPPGYKSLLLQAPASTGGDNNTQPADIAKAMDTLGLTAAGWQFSIAGPTSTRAQLIAGVQAWNQQMEKSGCASIGPAVPVPTPPKS